MAKVLLVDDESQLRNALADNFVLCGYDETVRKAGMERLKC